MASEPEGSRRPDNASSIEWSPTRGWDTVLPAASIQSVAVPGNHLTLMTDPANRAVLATTLANALQTPPPRPPHANDCYEPLIALNATSRRGTPLILVPGAGASVTAFAELAGLLGDQRPLYGLQPRGLQPGEVPHASVEAAAATYLEAITRGTPDGPLHLLGHSYGGTIAFEIARRLQARGRWVASLTLVDSPPPDEARVGVKDIPEPVIRQELVTVLRLSHEVTLAMDAAVVASGTTEAFVAQLHAAMVKEGLLPTRSPPDLLYGPLETFAAACRVVYIPDHPYTGPVRLALVRDPLCDEAADQLRRAAWIAGWRRWAPTLAVWHGPGHHFSILRPPQVQTLAAWWGG